MYYWHFPLRPPSNVIFPPSDGCVWREHSCPILSEAAMLGMGNVENVLHSRVTHLFISGFLFCSRPLRSHVFPLSCFSNISRVSIVCAFDSHVHLRWLPVLFRVCYALSGVDTCSHWVQLCGCEQLWPAPPLTSSSGFAFHIGVLLLATRDSWCTAAVASSIKTLIRFVYMLCALSGVDTPLHWVCVVSSSSY